MKEPAGVEPIKFSRTGDDEEIDFVAGTQLQLAGFTNNGPAVSKYMTFLLSNRVQAELDLIQYFPFRYWT